MGLLIDEKAMDGKALREFVLDFFIANGAKALESSGDVVRFKLPKRLQEALALDGKEIKVAFPPFNVPLDEDVECILPGNPLLDRILGMAGERGKTSRLRLIPGKDVRRIYEDAIAKIRIINAEVMSSEEKAFSAPHLLFNFVVTYTSDEKREEFCSTLIDLVTGEVCKGYRDWFEEAEFEDADSGDAGEIIPSEIEHVYAIAREEVKNQIATKAREFINEANERFAREVSRIDAYYSARLREVREAIKTSEEKIVEAFYKLRAAKGSEDEEELEREYIKYREELGEFKSGAERDLLALEEERRRRISEESEKYHPRIQVRLINSAVILLPRFYQRLTLKTGPVTKNVDLIFDAARGALMDLVCERCGSALERAYLCSGGHLVCPSCTNICKLCGRAMCTDCYMARCEICNAPICKACSRRCAACGLITCKEHSHLCEECGEEFCDRCTFVCEVCGKTFCGAHVLECSRCRKPVCREHCRECIICGKTFCNDYIVYCDICKAPLCRDDSNSCSVCGKALCPKHALECALCGETICPEHAGKCSICGEVYCLDHLKKCPACSNHYCRFNVRQCSYCGREYCSQCVSDNLCVACKGLERVKITHPAVQGLLKRGYKGMAIEGFWYWEVGADENEFHISAMHVLRNYLFIVDRETMEVKGYLRGNILSGLKRLLKRGIQDIFSLALPRGRSGKPWG